MPFTNAFNAELSNEENLLLDKDHNRFYAQANPYPKTSNHLEIVFTSPKLQRNKNNKTNKTLVYPKRMTHSDTIEIVLSYHDFIYCLKKAQKIHDISRRNLVWISPMKN